MLRMEPSWLERPAFKRAEEWSKNLEALMISGFYMSLLAIAINLACGAVEEIKDDCILIHIDDRSRFFPSSLTGGITTILFGEKQVRLGLSFASVVFPRFANMAGRKT